jgi:uncharacterized membrane protein YfcA
MTTLPLAISVLVLAAAVAQARAPQPDELAGLGARTQGRPVRVWTAGGSPLEGEALFSGDGACLVGREHGVTVEAPPIAWSLIARVDVQRHRGWEGLAIGTAVGVTAWLVLANGDVDPRGASLCAVVGPALGGLTGLAVRRWQRVWPTEVHAHPTEWPASGPPAMNQPR